jgi:lysophospholipase L1-like esterase
MHHGWYGSYAHPANRLVEMIHQNVHFHNSVEAVSSASGILLQRVPDEVRQSLNPVAQVAALSPTTCELRWVDFGAGARVTLQSELHHEYVRIYRGDLFQEELCIEPGTTRVIELAPSPGEMALLAGVRGVQGRGFSRRVSRLRLSGTGRVRFLGIESSETGLRPPEPQECPWCRLLGYGSSITQGFSSARLAGGYLARLAHLKGWDVLNLGFGGSCHGEPQMANYLASRQDWSVAVLELGVNLLDREPMLSDGEFRERAHHLVDACSADPSRKVVVCTLFPGRHDLAGSRTPAEPWRRILREIVRSLQRPNLLLVEGQQLLDWSGLTTDLVHPSDEGHAMIAARLSAVLQAWES